MSDIFLVGGGTDEPAAAANYSHFLAASSAERPRVGCISIDEGAGVEPVERFMSALRQAGDCEPTPLLVPIGDDFDVVALDDLDALLVCGGLTPAYADALVPLAAVIRRWLNDGNHPYLGFSAGAMIASYRAIVGGWQLGGVTLCPEDCGEDLDELTVVDGLGLVAFAVEVHCAQWGTLSRLTAAVQTGAVPVGIALDEDTMLAVRGDAATVSGLGNAWIVAPSEESLAIHIAHPGETVALPIGP